jgi:hypothetical protein
MYKIKDETNTCTLYLSISSSRNGLVTTRLIGDAQPYRPSPKLIESPFYEAKSRVAVNLNYLRSRRDKIFADRSLYE